MVRRLLIWADIRDHALEHSDDKERPVGAAVYAANGKRVSLGTNHYREGDTPLPDKSNIVHAEVAAIEAAEEQGVDLRDATLFTTKAPCHACASRIAKAGFATVLMASPDPESSWYQEQIGAELYLAGVRVNGCRMKVIRETEYGDIIRDYKEWLNERR